MVNCKWLLGNRHSYLHYPVHCLHSPNHSCIKLVTNIDVALQCQAKFIIAWDFNYPRPKRYLFNDHIWSFSHSTLIDHGIIEVNRCLFVTSIVLIWWISVWNLRREINSWKVPIFILRAYQISICDVTCNSVDKSGMTNNPPPSRSSTIITWLYSVGLFKKHFGVSLISTPCILHCIGHRRLRSRWLAGMNWWNIRRQTCPVSRWSYTTAPEIFWKILSPFHPDTFTGRL